eukprot:scaffold2866_cov248-Pinguiococcus_pyrenoidosus.AAC.1
MALDGDILRIPPSDSRQKAGAESCSPYSDGVSYRLLAWEDRRSLVVLSASRPRVFGRSFYCEMDIAELNPPDAAEAGVERGLVPGEEQGLKVQWRTCRRCHQKFHEGSRVGECVYHPESYSGETAQRWLVRLRGSTLSQRESPANPAQPPGVTEGGGDVHYFWTCCGASDQHNRGCKIGNHMSFDEEEEV